MEIKTNIYSPKDHTIALYERELDETFEFQLLYNGAYSGLSGVNYKYTPEFKSLAEYNSKLGKYKIKMAEFFSLEKELLLREFNTPSLQEIINYIEKTEKQIPNSGGSADYYKLPTNSVELQDLIEYKNMNYALANIFKACYRYGENHHSDKLRDVNKILWFGERLKKQLEKSND